MRFGINIGTKFIVHLEKKSIVYQKCPRVLSGECQYIFKVPSVSGLQMAYFVKAGTKRKPQEMLKNGTNRLIKFQISIDYYLIGNEFLLKFLTYFDILSRSDIPFNTI